MRIQLTALALASLLCQTAHAACNANNCLRALRNPTKSVSASAFCSSYIQSTATVPATTTLTISAPGPTGETSTTVTTTITSTIVLQAPDASTLITTTVTSITTFVPVKKRANPLPTYLSPCPDASAVSSACSCFISGRSTTTVTSTSTVTTTSTAPGTTSTLATTTTIEIDTTTTNPPTKTITDVTTSTILSTATACPLNPLSQVVLNSGFETGTFQDPTPWVLSRTGNEVVFKLSYCGLAGPGRDCALTGNGCSCLFANADNPGGTGFARQTLTNACVGKSYNFVAYLGRSDNIINGSVGQSSITADLDGVVIFPPIFPCSDASPCPLQGGSGPYLKVGPIVVTPLQNSPVLTFTIASTVGTVTFNLDVFVDDVTMTVI